MPPTGPGALAALAAFLLVVPGPARAQGIPAYDGRDETVLVGGGNKADVLDSSGHRSSEAILGAGPSAPGTARTFLLEAPAASLQDGFVRARITPTARGSATLLFRAGFEAGDPNRLRGYGLTVAGGAIRWSRFDDGGEREPGEKATLPDLQNRTSIELVLWAVGPHMVAQAFDADTLASLATLVFTDTRYAEGRIGFRVVAGPRGLASLTFLSVRRAGQKPDTRDRGVGSVRIARVRADALGQADAALGRKTEVLVVPPDAPDWRVIRTNAAGIERLARARVDVQQVTADEPFQYADAAYRSRRGLPPERTATGFRVDRSYKDPAMVQDLLHAYAQRFPRISRLVEIGRTSQGRPLLALKISDHADRDEDQPAILLVGGMHGGELLTIEFVMDAIQVLLERYETDPAVGRWVNAFEIWCVPQANPDGTAAFLDVSRQMDRKNARDTDGNGRVDPTDGVDLNRNFPFRWGMGGATASHPEPGSNYYRGPAPASEAETQALMRLAESERFAAALSFHTQANSILVPYTIDGARSPEPNEAWTIAQEIAKATPVQSNGRRLKVRRNIYPVDGTDQDWYRAALGTVAYIIEGPYECPLDEAVRLASVATIRPVWMGLLDRYLAGPTVQGRVLDPQGQPVAAEVTIKGASFHEGERWTARCRDGRFDRLLDRAGTITLEARLEGRVVATRPVQVTAGAPVRVDLQVPATKDSPAQACPDGNLGSAECACAARKGRCVSPGLPRFCP